jgi:hypothetical protein
MRVESGGVPFQRCAFEFQGRQLRFHRGDGVGKVVFLHLHVSDPQHKTPKLVVGRTAQSFFRRDDGGAVVVDDGPAVANVKVAGLRCGMKCEG